MLEPILEPGEEMRDIPDYEGIYAITTLGRAWSYPRVIERSDGRKKTVVVRWLKASKNLLGQKYTSKTSLWFQSQRKNFIISRLVAQAFIPNPDNKPAVDHLDGDSENNHVSNLKWVTAFENTRHEIATGIVNRSEICKQMHIKNQKPVTNKTGQVYKSATFASLLFGKKRDGVYDSIRRKCRCANRTWSYI